MFFNQHFTIIWMKFYPSLSLLIFVMYYLVVTTSFPGCNLKCCPEFWIINAMFTKFMDFWWKVVSRRDDSTALQGLTATAKPTLQCFSFLSTPQRWDPTVEGMLSLNPNSDKKKKSEKDIHSFRNLFLEVKKLPELQHIYFCQKQVKKGLSFSQSQSMSKASIWQMHLYIWSQGTSNQDLEWESKTAQSSPWRPPEWWLFGSFSHWFQYLQEIAHRFQ